MIGLSVFDELTNYTVDNERNITYPPMTCFNDDRMAERCGYKDAIPVVFSIKGNPELNHDIALTLKAVFQEKTITLLDTDLEAKDHLLATTNFAKKGAEEQARILAPFLQTTALQNEIINLDAYIYRGFLRVQEKGNTRKDRYSSLAYGVYLIKQLEKDLKKPSRERRIVSLW